MVAAGLLDTHAKHAEAVTNMAFGMMQEAGKVLEPTNRTPLQVCQMYGAGLNSPAGMSDVRGRAELPCRYVRCTGQG